MNSPITQYKEDKYKWQLISLGSITVIIWIGILILMFQKIYQDNMLDLQFFFSFVVSLILTFAIYKFWKKTKKEIETYILQNSNYIHACTKPITLSDITEEFLRKDFIVESYAHKICFMSGNINKDVRCGVCLLGEEYADEIELSNSGFDKVFAEYLDLVCNTNKSFNLLLIFIHVESGLEGAWNKESSISTITNIENDIKGFIVLYSQPEQVLVFPDAIGRVEWMKNSNISQLYALFQDVFKKYMQ